MEKMDRIMAEHDGHRKRLLNKIRQDVEADLHECLEAFLFPLIPRVNTNPIAHKLISTFGDIKSVFTAPIEELEKIEGVGPSTALYIHITGKMFGFYKEDEKSVLSKSYNQKVFLASVKREYETLLDEVVDIYFLGNGNEIVGRCRCGLELSKVVQLDVKSVAKIVKEKEPKGIVVLHNHPASANARPSKSDNEATRLCDEMCKVYHLQLYDHFIVSKNGIFSYDTSGALEENREFNVFLEMVDRGKINE